MPGQIRPENSKNQWPRFRGWLHSHRAEDLLRGPAQPLATRVDENTNGPLRQFMPRGIDLAELTQEHLNAIVWLMNTRPRKVHGFRCPLSIFMGFEQALSGFKPEYFTTVAFAP